MEKSDTDKTSEIDKLASEDIEFDHGQVHLVEEPPEEQKKHWLRNRVTLSLLSIFCLAIVFWLVASVYLPKVRLGDQLLAAHQPDSALQTAISQHTADYRLTIGYPDGSKKNFSLGDMGLKVNAAATVVSLRHQEEKLAAQLEWWNPVTAYLSITTNDSRLDSFVAKEATVTKQPAIDATISIVNGKVQVTNGVAGEHYGLIDSASTLIYQVSLLHSNPLQLTALSTRPAITNTQLASSQTKLQQILHQNVIFTIGSKQVQVSSSDIADWIEISPTKSGRDVNVTVNSGKVLDYINKIATGSIHLPKAQVVVSHADGTSSVLVAGINGTDIVGKSTVATDVANNLLADKNIQEDLKVDYSPYETITAQAYPKWIEVDTTNKRLYAYEGSTLVQTFLVSAGAPATPTVTGQYAIYAKYTQQDMYGRNVDGSSYFQPKVPWVNYFYADFAIHGNYWRPTSYFGNINSSHGCVGLVDNDAQWVYDWAPIGTPVIIHT